MSGQTRFFKATRPDGTDFYTATVDYAAALESGEPLPELSGGEFPGTGWYHVGVQSTSCAGMSWPCRLFVVEPVGLEHVGAEKAGCRSLRVVEERPAHEVFGPQGVQVVELLNRCASLTAGEGRQMVAARSAAWDAAMDAARSAARDAARDAAMDAVRSAARDAAWDAAMDAVRDAAFALVVRDLISEEHYATLTGPWASVIGPVHPDDEQAVMTSLIEAVCEEAWGIDLRQESGETRRLFARDAARIITVVQEWGRES